MTMRLIVEIKKSGEGEATPQYIIEGLDDIEQEEIDAVAMSVAWLQLGLRDVDEEPKFTLPLRVQEHLQEQTGRVLAQMNNNGLDNLFGINKI